MAPLIAYADLNGTLKSSTDIYNKDLGAPTETIIPYGILDLNGKTKFTKKLRFQYRLFALANFESKSSPEKAYGDVPEAYLDFKMASSARLRLGMNTVNWAVTDVSSPSDVVNPLAIFHPLRIYKRGSPMLELQYDKEVLGVHAIYIPRQRRSLLPSEDSRWLPRQFLVNLSYNGEEIEILPFLNTK